MTGNMFFLDTFGGAQASNYRSTVTKYNASTMATSEFTITIGSTLVSLKYALDMKIDSVRRKMWILDSGNIRILRINLDAGIVDRAYYPEGLIAPCSMAIDYTTGTAYFRALNGMEDFTGWSSSSSTEEAGSPIYKETIYAATDNGVIAIIEAESLLTYADKYLTPSTSDIAAIVVGNESIPLPNSSSMQFDQTRRNLWWTSKDVERVVFMTSVADMVMSSVSVASSMTRIKGLCVNTFDGGAIVFGSRRIYGSIAILDKTCSLSASSTIADTTVVNNAIVSQNEMGCIIPLYCTVEANLSELSSSSSGDESCVNVENLDPEQIAEPQGPETSSSGTDEEWEALTQTTSLPRLDVTVVSMSENLLSTAVWPIKSNQSLANSVSSAFRTPIFSWRAQASTPKPAIVATTTDGDLVKAELDLTEKTTSVVLRCVSPTDGAVLGLSAVNGNSHAYISGGGILAKICLDPTLMGTASTFGSSSSSMSSSSESRFSSQSDSKSTDNEVIPSETNEVIPSETIEDTEVGGLSVQFHDTTDVVYACSKQEGMVYVFSGVGGWSNKTAYGPFPGPFKAVPTSRHSGIIVACAHNVSLLSLPSGSKRLISGFPASDVTDVSVRGGYVGISIASSDRLSGMVKVLNYNLTSNASIYVANNEFPSKICLLETGKAVVALERIDSGLTKTRFVIAGLGDASSLPSGDLDGEVASIFIDDNFGVVLAAMKSGKILTISQNDSGTVSVTSVGAISGGVSLAVGGLVSSITDSETRQKTVRIFVGSREGANDRWDSGNIRTTKTEIVYGGGDNLMSGEAYWVSVSIMDSSNKWSAPATKQFVVPIM